MYAEHQISQIIARIKAKQKVSHHGGKYCKIGGKTFYRKHLMKARQIIQAVRAARRNIEQEVVA